MVLFQGLNIQMQFIIFDQQQSGWKSPTTHNMNNQHALMSLVTTIQSLGTVACRLLQRLLVVLIFVLYFIFSYQYLQFLFQTPPHRQPISQQHKILYLSIGIWLLYNLVYNYVMANRVGPGFGQHISKKLLNKFKIKRRCKKCGLCKPIRTHHCSICNKCVLQMDHHCPWMGVCIGHNNRRYFINFLNYLASACYLVVILIVNLQLPRSQVYMFMLTIGIIISLFALYHWIILLRGRTTLQLCEIIDGYKPSKSIKTNLQIIFGTSNLILAILPIYRKLTYTGCEWQINTQISNNNRLENIQLRERTVQNVLQVDQSVLVGN